jgi:hypothetical protein
MLTVFILCAGNGDRWNDYLRIPKQKILFGGEALIERTARLVTEQEQRRVYFVARDSRILLPQYDTVFVPRTKSLAETILATYRFWDNRNVFLLGDVFYAERAISLILGCQRGLAFFGRPWPSAYVKCGHGEMFGLTFSTGNAGSMCSLLERGLSSMRTGAQANLWNLYQLAAGLPLGSSRYHPQLLVPIDDCTNDIDTPIDYQRRRWLYEKVSSEGERGAFLTLRSLTLLPKHYLGIFRWRMSSGYAQGDTPVGISQRFAPEKQFDSSRILQW